MADGILDWLPSLIYREKTLFRRGRQASLDGIREHVGFKER